jgi:AraC family transcriptional regulator, positive regulator of tynA and feaB
MVRERHRSIEMGFTCQPYDPRAPFWYGFTNVGEGYGVITVAPARVFAGGCLGLGRMAPVEEEDGVVRRWTTANVAPPRRLDYFSAAINETVLPFSIQHADPHSFQAEIEFACLDVLRVTKVDSCPLGSMRGPSELARTQEHRYNIVMVTNSSWNADHRGRIQLAAGDILICDSEYPFTGELRSHFTCLDVGVSHNWVRRWIPNPNVLVARRIVGHSPWGRALTSYVSSLSPSLAAAPPLPLSILADQVGSLLALAASGLGATHLKFSPSIRSLHARILDCIAQRCTECELTAAHVAVSVNISLRTLHRTLAAANQTFGAQLIQARVRVAERLLSSQLFDRVTTAEIGRRSGFVSASHFARVIRRHTGRTPVQLRRSDS